MGTACKHFFISSFFIFCFLFFVFCVNYVNKSSSPHAYTPTYNLIMQQFRNTLPIYIHKQHIIDTIQANDVVLISGATG
jgi:hypothetical protein